MAAVKDTPENRRKCVCPRCPSFPRECGEETLYCALGKSRCEIRPLGCVCGSCAVYYESRLKGLYFCDKEDFGGLKIFMRKQMREEDADTYRTIVGIKEVAATGESVVGSMGSPKKLPYSLDDLHFVPAQVDRIPLNREQRVNTRVVVGPRAKKPLAVSSPILISGMSFGATSRNVKLVVSRVAAKLQIAYNTGEGGMLEEERTASKYVIGQYYAGKEDVDEDVLGGLAAVELRFGQGAYPGKGSYLPASKITPDIAEARGIKGHESSYSPAHHHDITTPKQVEQKVSWLREVTGGVPIGAKLGCGDVEKDVRVLVDAGVDFIALDGFGGGTGATNPYVREHVGIPVFAALPRAAGLLGELGAKDDVTLIAGGGLRTSADFAKCLALGADAVYIATAALIAVNCEQYRICHTGRCPTGVTTHNPDLDRQLDVEEGARRLSNFIRVSTREMAELARVVGKRDVGQLNGEDLVSMTRDMAILTGTRWLDGKRIPR